MLTFNEVYQAVVNKRLKTLPKGEVAECVARQQATVDQQRAGLLSCLFGRRRAHSGRVSKFATEHDTLKASPWFDHLESERVLAKHNSVTELYEKLQLVKKGLGVTE